MLTPMYGWLSGSPLNPTSECPGAMGTGIFDADSRLMETPDWLPLSQTPGSVGDWAGWASTTSPAPAPARPN